MACLAFGRAGSLGQLPPGERRAQQEPADYASLELPDDPRLAAADSAVFDALARQVTAFICTLDEATVNVGAAEPPSLRPTIHVSSSSASASAAAAAASSSAACAVGPPYQRGLFRRLRAAGRDYGFGWREARAAFEAAMQRENRCERMVARADAAAAERRLHQRLLVGRLEAVAFKGCSGGNSLFEALSLAIWGTPAAAAALRALAVTYADEHPAEFRGFLGDDWEAYLAGMSRTGTPGDELMLRAVSCHFGLPINIATSDAFMWLQRYAPPRTRTQREVTLAFLGPNTWMPVRRQSAMAALKLTLTGSSDLRAAREVRRKMQQQLELHPGTPPGSPPAPPGAPRH